MRTCASRLSGTPCRFKAKSPLTITSNLTQHPCSICPMCTTLGSLRHPGALYCGTLRHPGALYHTIPTPCPHCVPWLAWGGLRPSGHLFNRKSLNQSTHLQRLPAVVHLALRLIKLLPHAAGLLILAGKRLALVRCLLAEVLVLDVGRLRLCICSCLCILRICQPLLRGTQKRVQVV